MDALGAVNWVNENREVIENWISRKLLFTPYSMEDYMGDAMKAALIAANKMASGEVRESVEFCKVFWQTFKDEVAAVTPYPIDDEAVLAEAFEKAVECGHSVTEARKVAEKRLDTVKKTESRRRSVSLPNTFHVPSAEGEEWLWDKYKKCDTRMRLELDTEAAVREVSKLLKPIEREVLVLSIGLNPDGRHTQEEIAAKTHRDRTTIRIAQKRICEKISRARQVGAFRPDEYVRWRDPFEDELRLAS